MKKDKNKKQTSFWGENYINAKLLIIGLILFVVIIISKGNDTTIIDIGNSEGAITITDHYHGHIEFSIDIDDPDNNLYDIRFVLLTEDEDILHVIPSSSI